MKQTKCSGCLTVKRDRLRRAIEALLPWAENWLPDDALDQGARDAIQMCRAALKENGDES